MVDVNRAWDFKTACDGVKLLEALFISFHDNDSHEDTSRGGLSLEAFKPRWLEEPVPGRKWLQPRRNTLHCKTLQDMTSTEVAWEDDRRLLKLLSQRTTIPLSGGERLLTEFQ